MSDAVFQEERLKPNAVEVALTICTKLVTNYREGVTPSVDFPSQWRLAKHVVHERSPLVVFHYGESEP